MQIDSARLDYCDAPENTCFITRGAPEIRWRLLLLLALVFSTILAAASARGFVTATRGNDAGLIAFELDQYDQDGHQTNASIWTVASDGSGLRRLTSLNGDSENPAWSPDGRKIAYESGSEISVMNADGTGNQRLTRSGLNDSYEPRWSPNGKRIVYVYSGREDRIRIMNADGSHVRTLRFASPVSSMSSSRIGLRTDGGSPLSAANRWATG
jgi:dipeptidyl aminopeptidase/acylaminoacyl peptidase